MTQKLSRASAYFIPLDKCDGEKKREINLDIKKKRERIVAWAKFVKRKFLIFIFL